MSASAGRVLIIPRGTYNSGTAYERQDSVFFNGSSYICLKDSLGHAPTDSEYWQIMAQGAGVISGAFAGACDSLGSAQVKSVIIPPADNFALQKGVIVGVRFTNTNTFEATSENSIALNVNNTGALPIYFNGTATPLGDNVVAFGEAAYTHFYQYDGSNWVFIGRSGVQTAEQTPYDSTKSTKAAIDELADKLVTTSETVTGNPLSFTTDSAQPSQNTVITFEPIQSGSGDPSPSNVRPISGYNSADIGVPKKNLFNKDANNILNGYVNDSFLNQDGTTSSSALLFISEYILIDSQTDYYVSGLSYESPSLAFYDSSKTFISGIKYNDRSSFGITTPNNAKYIRLSIPKANAGSIQLEKGSSATAYEPYNQISEPFPSTVYGGTLDVESGELVVDRIYQRYNGSEIWSASQYQSNTYLVGKPNGVVTYDSMCNMYTMPVDLSTVSQGYGIGTYVNVKDTVNGSTLEAFKTFLGSHPLDIVFKLATPITYHLTPHQVRLLEGANVVTSNGTSLSLTYRNGEVATLEDLDGLAESINNIQTFSDENLVDKTDIAYVETGTNASWSYSVGELVYVGGTLYRVATAISSGSAFTVGTNIVATTIGAEISKSTGGTLSFYASFSHYTVYNTYRANIFGYFKGLTATLTEVTIYNSGGGTSDITSACTLLRSNDYELEVTTANSVSDLYAAIQVTLS